MKIDISIFILLFGSALDQFLKIILNATLPIINHYNTNTGKTNIDASVSNNNKPLPLVFIGHECTWPIIHNSYQSANPNPQTHDPPSTDEVFALSAFLQTHTWPLCVQNDKCEKPTIVHWPDVCIAYKELHNLIPAGGNMFHIPIFICEEEGLKSVWGEGEQESKAIEEACYALSFIPENYIIFIYARRFEFLTCKRNPHTGSIDIEKQIVYMQQDGDTLRDKLISVMKTIVKMLIKQFTCGKRLIDIAIPLYRQMGWDGIDIFHPHKNVCLTCWHIQTLVFAPQMFYASPNNLPTFE